MVNLLVDNNANIDEKTRVSGAFLKQVLLVFWASPLPFLKKKLIIKGIYVVHSV